jgi:hypothetical protein
MEHEVGPNYILQKPGKTQAQKSQPQSCTTRGNF